MESAAESEWEAAFLQALGYLLVQANQLEDSLIYVYWVASGKNWDGVEDDVRDLTLGPLLGLVTRAYEKRFPELRQRLDDLRPALDQAVETRHAYVHARWVFSPAEREMERERLPRKRPGVREIRRLTVADVEAAIEIVGSAAIRVMDELYDPAAEIAPPSAEIRIRNVQRS